MQDLVSVADRAVEDLMRARLSGAWSRRTTCSARKAAAPDEPPGARERGALWVIDPIDGTANFLRGMPYWSVALAYVVDDRVEIGVTYDPVHDELFWARRGGGALPRPRADPGQRLRPTRSAAVVGSTFTFKMKIERLCRVWSKAFCAPASDHRRMGSTALMMCHVADGRLDGCVTGYCNSWDVIGGLLLVAGGGRRRQRLHRGERPARARQRARVHARPAADPRGGARPLSSIADRDAPCVRQLSCRRTHAPGSMTQAGIGHNRPMGTHELAPLVVRHVSHHLQAIVLPSRRTSITPG